MEWLNSRVKASWLLYLLIALCIGVALFYIRYVRSPGPSISVGTVTVAKTPKGAVKARKIKTPPPKEIVVYDKFELSAKLKMPELKLERGDPLAVAEIPSHIGPTTTIAMLDNTTGETRIIMRPEPPPFFQLKKEFGVRAGFGTGNLIIGELYFRPLAVNPRDARGQLNLEVRAFVRRTDADGSDFGGALLLDYRF